MPFTYSLPASVSFRGKGMFGYTFGPLKQKKLEIYYIEAEKGHDSFIVSKKTTRAYYILSGSGYFTIDSERYPVEAGVLVEIPPRLEYSYSGKMTLLCISVPRWSKGNDAFTKWNPDVVACDSCGIAADLPWRARLWKKALARIGSLNPIRWCVKVLHKD
jgi:mannose-6-phosphate isomerase-like protein (cupin superfamily)